MLLQDCLAESVLRCTIHIATNNEKQEITHKDVFQDLTISTSAIGKLYIVTDYETYYSNVARKV